MNIKPVRSSQKSVSILLIFSIFLVFSCSSNNSITDSPNKTNLSKPADIVEINNPCSRDNPYQPVDDNSHDMIDLDYGVSIVYHKWKDSAGMFI